MPRTVGASLEAHYQGSVTTLALCINLTLARWQPRITDITKANPGVVTTRWAHGYSTGDTVKIVGVEGMTQVNDTFFVVTVVNSTSFSIGVDTSGYSTYTKGSWYGTARKTLGFTTHTADLTFNGVLYRSSNGADGSAISTNADLSLSSRDVTVLIDSTAITVEDLERGVYSGAEYETFEVNYQDLTQGRVLLEVGRLGDITVRDQVFIAEGLSLVNLLHQSTGPTVSPVCRAQLGNRITDNYDERFGCKVRLNPPTWLASTAYTVVQQYDAALGSIVKPSTYNGRHFKCTTAGTSGGSEPSWNTALGATTSDNTVVWTAIEAWTKEGEILTVIDDHTFDESGRLEAEGFFSHGLLTFLTGDNIGWSTEINSFAFPDGATFEQAGTQASNSSAGNLTPTIPRTGVEAGDSLWLHVSIRNQTTTCDTPSGWTLISGPNDFGTTGRAYLFARTSTGTEPAGTMTVTFTNNAAVTKFCRIYRFRGGVGITLEGSVVVSSGTDDTIEAPTLTSLSANRLGLAFVAVTDDRAMAAFSGATGGTWVEPVAEVTTTTGDDGSLQLQTVEIATAGTVTGGAQTLAGGAADWSIIAVVLPVDLVRFVLRDRPPATMQAGDTYEIEAGCNKIMDTCKTKFDNVYNFRGEPWLPGFNKSLLYPDSR